MRIIIAGVLLLWTAVGCAAVYYIATVPLPGT
jgi:hypothetical protein